ncbi:MAG: SUMF1/EgtB/PvdO family nonheme iron enzyme [Anaerolineales bacterium]|nr:SUMF1/EgtB/PvdO family nonheme iron enzyme [Anaerolineales bacterium]
MTTLQKGRIFISYRRIDTSYAAGRIYDRLATHFGEDAIFMDVEVIEGGLDFVKVLEDAVQSCDVLIALIGRQWLNTKDEGGNRRLDNPEDFVRIEIAAALNRNIRVIPVLVDGIDMPRSTELPENLKPLARRNALQVNHHSFNPDVYRLITHIESALKAAEESKIIKTKAVKAAREKAEQEAAEKTAYEKAERTAAKKAAHEKAKREKAERQVARKAAIKQLFSSVMPFLRVIGIVGIIIALFLIGLWTIPKFNTPVPTAKAGTTTRPNATNTFTIFSIFSTKTVKPNATSTKIKTPISTSLPAEITDEFGVEMIYVPAGDFIARTYSSSQTLYTDAFYIDKYEVTNSFYRDCITATVCPAPTDTKLASINYFGNDKYANYPVVWVTREYAELYCDWRGARLPTDEEWQKAASGTDQRSYPWGNQTDDVALRANGAGIEDGFEITAPVGSFPLGVSPYGAYDMAGNVSEYISDYYVSISTGSEGRLLPKTKGGDWHEEHSYLNGFLIYSSQHEYVANSWTGFRCIRSVSNN